MKYLLPIPFSLTTCILLFSLLFSFNSPAFCQQIIKPSEYTMLWKIDGNGLSAPSYLYGTIHFVCENDIHLPDIAKAQLLESKEAFFEHDKASDEDDSIENKTFMNGETLKNLIGKFYFNRAKKIIKKRYQFSDDRLNKMMPFVIEQLVTIASMPCKNNSYDSYLEQIALKDSIKINFLESVHESYSIINALTLGTEIYYLKYTLDNIGEVLKNIKNSQNLYDRKDLIALFKTSTYTPNGRETAFSKIVLDTRNNLWLPVIENAIQQHACFFAFGCNHLVGTKGIIFLLLQKGYKVTPINY